MNRYAERQRNGYLEPIEDEYEEFFGHSLHSECRNFIGATQRRVISRPTEKLEKNRALPLEENRALPLEENRALQTYGSRTEIDWTRLHMLKPGDHIGWHRPYLIWHHAIVVSTDLSKREIKVIHFSKNDGKKEVHEEDLNVIEQKGELFRFDYSENITDVNPPEKVLARALLIMELYKNKKVNKKYNLFSNNCEHFAAYCKTGIEHCYQTDWALGKIKEVYHSALVNCVKPLVKEIGKEAYRNMAQGAGKVAAAATVKRIGKASNWAGAGWVAGIEALHCVYDVYHIHKNKKSGKITDKDFKVSTTVRMSEGVGGAASSIGGNVIGSMFGTWLGGTLGGFLPVLGAAGIGQAKG